MTRQNECVDWTELVLLGSVLTRWSVRLDLVGGLGLLVGATLMLGALLEDGLEDLDGTELWLGRVEMLGFVLTLGALLEDGLADVDGTELWLG